MLFAAVTANDVNLLHRQELNIALFFPRIIGDVFPIDCRNHIAQFHPRIGGISVPYQRSNDPSFANVGAVFETIGFCTYSDLRR